MRRVRKYRRLDRQEKLLLIESFWYHLAAGLMLKLVPFRKIPLLFAGPVEDNAAGSREHRSEEGESDLHDLERIKEAVRRAGQVSPWKNRCLVSSLAARSMLNRRRIGSTLSLGMARRPDGSPVAHAWITAGTCDIVAAGNGYTELYRF